jgi:hypothetical protein
MKQCCHQTESSKESGLQAERSCDHVGADFALLVCKAAIGHSPGTIANEDLANAIEADKGRCNASWMEGCKVWDVVKNATEYH